MRNLIVVVAACMLLVGCGMPAQPAPGEWDDTAGRSPDEAVLATIQALESHDWETAFSMYAAPSVPYEVAEREWIEADEAYESFDVQETEVVDSSSARVRVTYVVSTTPPGGEPYVVRVEEPGEWWPVYKVDGVWKLKWLPRQ